MIVPVSLYHQDKPDCKVQVYAVLDDQSDTCFITNEICNNLGLSGPEIILELGTMHSVENVKIQKIKGLVVSRPDGEVNIPLPRVYTREQIPARRDQIPRPEVTQTWKHLEPIAMKIPPYEEKRRLGILIGSNCVRAIKPREVVPGNANDPYAIRTVLGWGIVGAMFERDFSETQSPDKPLSQDDIKFMKITTEGIHQQTDDNHYEIPLPLRQEQLNLPSNRAMVEKRLSQLKNRFERNPQYKKDYIAFIDDMLEKGYAEEASEKCDKAWYIPHHGVYHPKKPGKIRVVFDCFAEYQGHSLNRQTRRIQTAQVYV
ncbi:hypothetical protein QZH41_001764 [Actinostola sp. cb2023]|nr:hypothetical protein QZH41_001764 [Actinostola sp. cb2023]